MADLLKDKIFLLKVAGFVLLGILAFRQTYFYTLPENKPVNYDYDEAMWTGSSIAAYYMFFKDYKRQNVRMDERWFLQYAQKEGIDVSKMGPDELQWFDVLMWTFGWKAPNVGKYIMGRKVVNSGITTDPQGYFFFNQEVGRIECNPPEELQLLARKPNAFLSALSILLVFLIGWFFIHYSVGLLAALWFLPNWYFHQVNSAAGLDASSLFFSLLTILLACFFIRFVYRTRDWKLLIGLAVGIGLCFGLAVGSKLNSALIGIVAIIVFGIMLVFAMKSGQASPPADKKAAKAARKAKAGKSFNRKNFLLQAMAVAGLIVGVLGIQTFRYFNPVFQTEPVKKMKVVRESVDDFFQIRANASKTDHIKASWMESFKLVSKRNFVDSAEDHSPGYQRHLYYGTFGNLLPFRGNPIDGILIAIGLGLLCMLAYRQMMDEQQVNPLVFLLIFFLVNFYGMVDFIWIDFPRYHTPLFPFFALFSATAISAGINQVLKKAKPEWAFELNGDLPGQ